MRRIGLWGAPSCGKTTYLASLFIAAARAKWALVGTDSTATDFMTANTDLLYQRRFPPPTFVIDNMSWILRGTSHRGAHLPGAPAPRPTTIRLDLMDSPGMLFGLGQQPPEDEDDLGYPAEDGKGGGTAASFDELVDRLVGCEGILYLYDPVRERDMGNEFRYFQNVLQRIAQICEEKGMFQGQYLPHKIAVCVTKFDDVRVLRTAYERKYLTYDPADPHRFPVLIPEHAENLYSDLLRVSSGGGAVQVHETIKTFFHRRRIRYFASSAIGFYKDPLAQHFQMRDFSNVQPGEHDDELRIRGPIRPINILEPLLWLGDDGQAAR